MDLEIEFKNSDLQVKLLKNKKTIDIETTKYYHNLSEVLITNIDRLLKRNNIDFNLLKGYKIVGNIGKESTSYKIAQAIIEGLKVSS